MRLAGVRGLDRPSLDVLALAENPPAADWRDMWPSRAAYETRHRTAIITEQDILAATERLVDSRAWRERQVGVRSRQAQVADPQVRLEAGLHLLDERKLARPVPVMVNQHEYERGQAAAKRWRGTLDQLVDILDALEVRVPDMWLASISEEALRAAADVAAELGTMTTPADRMDMPEGRRARCPLHHRRKLRRRAGAARQHVAALLGTVGQGGAAYADAYSVACWRERQAAARAFGLAHEVAFEDGKRAALWDIMDSSRKTRLAALYAQTLGLDQLAERRSLVPVFITMTLPPAYHPSPRHGVPFAGAEWEDAPSPEQADGALASMWTRLRARLAADGIQPIGLRVVEPHQDGCPHLHACLFLASEGEVETLDQHLRAVCPDPDGAERVASKLVRIDPSRARPSSYVMKYILKTVNDPARATREADGEERDGDPDHLAYHAEVSAWASDRRIRRFAWVGMHGLRTVWQRVRGMSDDERAAAPTAVRETVSAMESGRWGDAMEAMGIIRADRTPRPTLTYKVVQNGYGEDVKRADGITLDGWRIPLRRRACEIVRTAAPTTRTPVPTTSSECNKGFTVTVSCPRDGDSESVDKGSGGRTGPPERHPFDEAVARALNINHEYC